jgi:hypothetical protein
MSWAVSPNRLALFWAIQRFFCDTANGITRPGAESGPTDPGNTRQQPRSNRATARLKILASRPNGPKRRDKGTAGYCRNRRDARSSWGGSGTGNDQAARQLLRRPLRCPATGTRPQKRVGAVSGRAKTLRPTLPSTPALEESRSSRGTEPGLPTAEAQDQPATPGRRLDSPREVSPCPAGCTRGGPRGSRACPTSLLRPSGVRGTAAQGPVRSPGRTRWTNSRAPSLRNELRAVPAERSEPGRCGAAASSGRVYQPLPKQTSGASRRPAVAEASASEGVRPLSRPRW